MQIAITLNGQARSLNVQPHETLMTVLRREGMFSVKHGCETGECGACTVLIDGKPTVTCLTLAVTVNGKSITTLEALASKASQMHPLQRAFIESGAIQCGYCTPAQILCAKALLDHNPNPTEAEVRAAFNGVLCRCTGYVKPVQAVLRAAAVLRGEEVPPVEDEERATPLPVDLLRPFGSDTPHTPDDSLSSGDRDVHTQAPVKPLIVPTLSCARPP